MFKKTKKFLLPVIKTKYSTHSSFINTQYKKNVNIKRMNEIEKRECFLKSRIIQKILEISKYGFHGCDPCSILHSIRISVIRLLK